MASARKVKVYTVPGFRRRYKRFLPDSQIKSAMATFNAAKRDIPPTPLPEWMRDHKLHGRLVGISECHLANDVLLVYTHKDDVVTLLDCCTHDELTRDRGAHIRNRLRIASIPTAPASIESHNVAQPLSPARARWSNHRVSRRVGLPAGFRLPFGVVIEKIGCNRTRSGAGLPTGVRGLLLAYLFGRRLRTERSSH